MARKKEPYPTGIQVIQKSKSVVFWDCTESRLLKERKRCGDEPHIRTRIFIKIRCGKCKKERFSPISNVRKSIIKNTFLGYCDPCFRTCKWGEKNRSGATYRTMTQRGYVKLYLPSHPMANVRGEVPEHRFVMSQHLGRNLKSIEHVHHINGDKADNRLENLELLNAHTHRLISFMENHINKLETLLKRNGIQPPKFSNTNKI